MEKRWREERRTSMKEGEGRKAKEGRWWKKEAKISMKEGREEGERRKDIPTQTVLVGLGKRSNCLFIIQ